MIKRAGVAVSIVVAAFAYVGCSAPADPAPGPANVGSVSEADLNFHWCAEPLTTHPWLLSADCSCGNTIPGSEQALECGYEQQVLGCLRAAGLTTPCGSLAPLPVVQIVAGGEVISEDLVVDPMAFFPGAQCAFAVSVRTCITKVNNEVSFRGFPVRPYYPYLISPVAANFTYWCADAPGANACDRNYHLLDAFDPCTVSNCKGTY